MATTYGMGQYRMQPNKTYITQINGDNTQDHSFSPKIVKIKANTYTYQDIYFDLGNNGFKYGEVYYLELILPPHSQYTSDIDIKICGQLNNSIDIKNQFQNIKQITVPNSLANTNFYKDVLLYEDPNNTTNNANDIINNSKSKISIINSSSDEASDGEVYRGSNNKYFLKNETNNNDDAEIINYQSARIIESWKLKDADEKPFVYHIIFSPKFDNGSEGYPYLYLEIDRNNEWNTNIQYIENGNLYRGIVIDIEQAELKVWKINNLLNDAFNFGMPSSLNHIGVWGHPEMYLAINGEQIQIGKNGFYELNDFNINNLGVVVQNEETDRFSIDYEFIISDDDEEGE